MLESGSKSGARGSVDVDFDPHDPSFAIKGVPFEVMERIRRSGKAYRTASNAWYLSTFDDVASCLTDVETFRADLATMMGVPEGIEKIPAEEYLLSEIPEPRHRAVRRLITASMSPRRVKQIEPALREKCGRLVDAMLESDVADLHDGYAMAIPAFVMAKIMDLNEDVADIFSAWSWDGTLMQRPATPGVPPEGPASYVFFYAYLEKQRSLAEPSNELLKILLNARIDDQPLTDTEIVTQLHFLIQAGVHTTRSALTHLFNRLVQEPHTWDRLRNDPDQIDPYIEESLRRDSPVQRTTRRCTKDVVFAGVQMKKGEIVEVGVGSANHDEALFDGPEEFRMDRPNLRKHLAFGAGSHVCPGAALSRFEARVALETLFSRLDRMEMVPSAIYPPLPGSLGHQPVPARLVVA